MTVPIDAECNDQALAIDILQNHVKALDQLLQNMADIDDMIDELDDAEKKAGKPDDWQAAACRRARAYKALQPILTAAMRQSDEVEIQLAEFLKAAPKLAKRLAHWQSEGAT
jgi:predicted  nucleic acid-binding Zn-ribbon protein